MSKENYIIRYITYMERLLIIIKSIEKQYIPQKYFSSIDIFLNQ